MKTIFKISAILIAIFLLISLNSASAQWVSGSSSGSSLTDVIVFDSNAGAAYVSGTFSPTDPLSVYDNMYTQGPAHYYRIVASTTTGSSSFLLSDNSSQWVTLTILDSNLKKIVTANALTGYVSGNRSALLNYTMTSGSTYYVETHCLGSVGGAVPFTFVISGGVSSISQVEQGAHGVGSGVPLFNGALLGNSAASHARPGCYADYYQLTGDGVTDLIMSGFDTYLYLYDSQFHLIAKNDDANPPGHGGSLIHQILSMGSVAMSGTTIHDAGAALIFTSGTVTATKNTVISSNTWIDYTYWYNINTGAILYYTFDFISDFSTNISTDLVTGTSGVGSKVIDGSQTLATSFVTVASGSGSTVNPGVGTHISGTTNTWNEVWNPNTMSYNVTISSGTVSIPVTGGTCSLTTGSSTTITTGTGYELIQLPFFVEATSYTKHLTGSYTLSTSVGGLVKIGNPWDPTLTTGTSAVPLAYTVTGNLSSSAVSHARGKYYYANYYQVQPTTSGAVSIEVTGSIDTYLYLYDSNLNPIALNNNYYQFGVPYACKISTSLTAGSGSVYYIEVTTYRPYVTGPYTMTVLSPATGGASGSIAPTGNPF